MGGPGIGFAARLRARLAAAPLTVQTLVAGFAGFGTYFAMYGFRKPYTALAFNHVAAGALTIDYKSLLVIAQIVGYAISKIVGVGLVGGIQPQRRGPAIVLLVGLSWAALILFALVPPPWNIAAMFLNGLPLGMIWGLVFSFVEGRRTTELLSAMLCASFILSSGVAKSLGSWLALAAGIPPLWVPAVAGLVFAPLLLLCVAVLTLLPAPSLHDVAARAARVPVDKLTRRAFLWRHILSLTPLIASYVALSALRDFRDNFAVELWDRLGFGGEPSIFTASELPIAAVTLAALALLALIRDNRRALVVGKLVIIVGFMVAGGATIAFRYHLIGGLAWMILVGVGTYLGYTPYNASLFDRFVAIRREPASAAYLIMVADSFGYVGSVILLVVHDLAAPTDWLRYFAEATEIVSLIGIVGVAAELAFTGLRDRTVHRLAAGERRLV